ncbi:MAG: insulinase family protein [Oscillospiraceae bacterium]|nr:insulinase family protein [Oscillospiraceae bacterium]
MYIEKVLSNGIRVAAERVPYVQSVSVGVWVGNGSRHERAEENGISHFIEHMVFKGAGSRSARDIALEMDSVGGQMNAFTTRECTCFYAKTLNEYVEKSVDILSDMVFEPLLSAEDMELEKRVVLEEIAMYEDSPEDVVYDLFDGIVWGDTPMGRPILGTPDILNSITPDIMREYMRTHYTSKNIVIAVSGSFDDSIFDLLEKYFGGRKISDAEVKFEPVSYHAGRALKNRDFEQVQLIAGFNGIDIYDDAVYSLLAFNNIFGSGMSSRLFQNIREKYGLVYTIGAGHSAYIGAGTFDISAAVSPENIERVSELIVKEIKKLKAEKLTADELLRAKIQLKGNYIMSNEHIGARMQTIGRAALLGKRHMTPEETIKKIEAVDLESVSNVIDKVLDESTLTVAAAGPIDSVEELFTLN